MKRSEKEQCQNKRRMRLRKQTQRSSSVKCHTSNMASTTNATSAPPKHVYKIFPASAAPPSLIPAVLPLSELDAKDGFIHLSDATQTALTADMFFGADDIRVLYIAKIPLDRADPKGDDLVKWEVEGSPGCAHLYNGPKLGSEEIADVRKFERGPGKWAEVLVGDKWFEV